MTQAARIVRAFISSTFRDMQAERDHLVTVVFPELRERLDRLGIEFYDVDLRWGVPETGVDGERANSWAYCRQWIDRVEPFFVCILGQRYGWTPPGEQMSITEMELRHAVLSGRLRRRSFFHFRGTLVPPGVPAEVAAEFADQEQERVERLKHEIAASSGRPVRNYRCRWNGERFDGLDEEFGPMVLEDLWSGVLRDSRYVSPEAWRRVLGGDPEQFPVYTDDFEPVPRTLWERIVEQAQPAPAGPLEADAEQMASFAAARLRWFQGREEELGELVRFVGEDQAEGRIGIVRGEPGVGKSALMARLDAELADSGFATVTHFIGSTERSADLRGMLNRLNRELDRRGAAMLPDDPARQDTERLRRRLARRLEEHSSEPRIVLLIDGVNQLAGGQDFDWLPPDVGPNVRIVLSCTDDAPLRAALQARVPGARWVTVPPLGADDVRRIVAGYLIEYCKELDAALIDSICAMERAKNPLYLLVMLGELRTLGGKDMNRVVASLIPEIEIRYPDAVSLFDWVLERLEVFGREAVRLWFTYLSLGRAGMSSRELSDLLARRLGPGAARTALLIERGIRRYLAHRGAQLDFFHVQLRTAVSRRYLRGDAAPFHRDIAGSMSVRWREGDGHAISELPYHQAMGGEWEALHATLNDAHFQREKSTRFTSDALIDDAGVAVAAACAKAEMGRALLPIRFAILYDRLRDNLPGPATAMTELVRQRDFTAAFRLVRGEPNRRLQFVVALAGAWQAALDGQGEEAAAFIAHAGKAAGDGVDRYTSGATLAAVRALARAGLAEAVDLIAGAALMRRFIDVEERWLATAEASQVCARLTEAAGRMDDVYARCGLLESLGRIAEAAGESDRARALFDRALEDTPRIDDPHRRARRLSALAHDRAPVDDAIRGLPPGEWRLCALAHLAAAAAEHGDHARALALMESAIEPEHAEWKKTLQSRRPQKPGGEGTVSGAAAEQFLQWAFYDRRWLPACLADLAVALLRISAPAAEWAERQALDAASKAEENRAWYDEFLIELADKYRTAGFDEHARALLRDAQARLDELSNAMGPRLFVDHAVRLASALDRIGEPALLDHLRSSLRGFADDSSAVDVLAAIAKGFAAIGQTGAARDLFARAIEASMVADADERSRRLANVSRELGHSLTVAQAPEAYARLRREAEILAGLTSLAAHTVMSDLAEAFHKGGDAAACQEVFAAALRAATLSATASDYVFRSVIEVADRCYAPEYGPSILACIADLLARASFSPEQPAPESSKVDDVFIDLEFLANTSSDDRTGASVELGSALAGRIERQREAPRVWLSRLEEIACAGGSAGQVHFFTTLASAAMEAGLHDDARQAMAAAVEVRTAHFWPVLDALRESARYEASAAWAPAIVEQLLVKIGRHPEPASWQFASAAGTLKRLGKKGKSLRAAWRALMLTRGAKETTERHRQRTAIARDLHDVAGGWLSSILLQRAEHHFWSLSDDRRKYQDLTEVLEAWLATGRRTRAEKLGDATGARLHEEMALLPAKILAQVVLIRDLGQPRSGAFVNFLDDLAGTPMQRFDSQTYSLLEHFSATIDEMADPVSRLEKRQQLLSRLPSIVASDRYRLPLETRLHRSIARDAPEEAAALRHIGSADARLRIIPEVAAEIRGAPLDAVRWKALLDLLVASLAGSEALRRVLASVIMAAKDDEVLPIATELLDSRMFAGAAQGRMALGGQSAVTSKG